MYACVCVCRFVDMSMLRGGSFEGKCVEYDRYEKERAVCC